MVTDPPASTVRPVGSLPFRKRAWNFCLAVAWAVCLCCCRKAREITVYEVPLESDAAVRQAPAASNDRHAALPKLSWPALPSGWTHDAKADGMNSAKFSVGEGGDAAFIQATALEPMAGKETVLVNMWRNVLGQAQLSDGDALKTLVEVPIGSFKGKMFEVSGSQKGAEVKIVTAFFHQEDHSWFFKLQGPPVAVDKQRESFVGFLKTVRFEAAVDEPAPAPTGTPGANAAAPPSNSAPGAAAKPVLPGVMPEGWKAVEPGPMQVAKYAVPPAGESTAEATVSIFPSDTGGVAANVLRWRGQLQLPSIDETAAAAAAQPLAGGPEGSVTVQLENNGKALVGVIVPRPSGWYFYKLLGDSPAVAAAKEAFLNFAKTKP